LDHTNNFFKHILVPADGSQLSIVAGKMAINLAKVTNAKITFVYIIDEKVVTEVMNLYKKSKVQVIEDLRAKGYQYLDYLAKCAKIENLETKEVVLTGVPYIQIESLVRDLDIDLVVMGQLKERSSRGFLIGSTTQRVIENVGCPVLVAK